MAGAAGGQAAPAKSDDGGDSWEYRLRKCLLLLATLVATVTYGAAFNPPGGVWQDAAPAVHRIAGDPIIRETRYWRYVAFFYSNATAFASSLVVIVLVLILAVLHERGSASLTPLRILRVVMVLDLLSLMGAYAAGAFRDMLTAIYSLLLLAGVAVYLAVHMLLAWRDHINSKKSPELPAEAPATDDGKKGSAPERLRKVLMLLATFAVSVTYVAGLSAPGGFWDHEEGGHRPGDAVLKGGRHDARLKAFFVSNTTSFVASLLVIIILLEKKLCFSRSVRSAELYAFIAVVLVGLVGAYSAGSCRHVDTTIYVNSLIGAVIACVLLQAAIIKFCEEAIKQSWLWNVLGRVHAKVSGWLHRTKESCLGQQSTHQDPTRTGNESNDSAAEEQQPSQSQLLLEKARSLVLLLATLALAITYQAGLNPPGGLWQDDGDGYKAGDPILLTTNPRRYKAFYYCNSTAFVASLVAVVLVRMKTLHHHNALEAAMILDLFGLMGAYAAGSCRDVTTSVYAVALAGAVLVYVVLHVVFFTLDHNDGKQRDAAAEQLVEKRRKRLLLFAILAATITYQAGLTPPSGFLVADDPRTGRLAGDPVLFNNYPRRYAAFFYCNSASFMLSIALIILMVNPNLYRPAIRSYALSICTAAGMIGIMGAYAAGCTQHIRTSIYIFALAGFVLAAVVVAVVFLAIHERKRQQQMDRANRQNRTADEEAQSPEQGSSPDIENGLQADTETGGAQNSNGSNNDDKEADDTAGAPEPNGAATGETDMGAESGAEATEDDKVEKELHAKRKYLMLLGILVASVTYQAGLAPPGGVWQANDSQRGRAAGDPVMHDNRRHRYLAFYYSNSTSFVASVVVIVLLLPPPSMHKKWWWAWWLGLMKTAIGLNLLGLLVAYAAGSSRSWKTAGNVSALVFAVLAYFVVHVVLSCFVRRGKIGRLCCGRTSAQTD